MNTTAAGKHETDSQFDPQLFALSDPHGREVRDVLSVLRASLTGLSSAQVERRLELFGPNQLPVTPGRSMLQRLAAQFNNVLIYVLVVAAVVTAWLGHFLDAGVITGVVVVNALIGFLQEGRAEQSLAAIRNLMSDYAVVLRNGTRTRIAAQDLVPGDIVVLAPGDKVPADLRLTKCKGLQIQEASLTGESVPSDKSSNPVDRVAALGDRHCMAYSSTIIVRGQGLGIVTATGEQTEIGRVKGLLQSVQTLETPLTQQLSHFGRVLTIAILFLAALTVGFGVLFHGASIEEMFMAAVGLAVAAIPEGLPAIVTITLAIGVERMAKRRAIIRRLPAVETLGAVSVICSDKTGTFTRNEMMIQSIATSRDLFSVTGNGYATEGNILLKNTPVAPEHRPLLHQMATAAALCNDAELFCREGDWSIEGDPMEGAMLAFVAKTGTAYQAFRNTHPRLDEIPFDSEHRFMATLSKNDKQKSVIFVKGAPERLLEMCGRQVGYEGEEPLDKAYWEDMMLSMSSRGERVLALAVKTPSADLAALGFVDVETDLSLLGLFGFIDPPRIEAIEAVARCKQAGINVKMITGDHIGTAKAIGKQLGLEYPDAAINGAQLDHLSDKALEDLVDDIDVFARTSPEGKLRIVRALQAKNNVVAMTGDGVNDAPALKQADVGVAMGLRGTEAAKEAGEMVLADDNFSSIAAAVEEGRTVYDNLIKAIQFILPTNGGEAMTIMAAILLGLTIPITPVQILWVNMVTAVTLALALTFETPEGTIMARPPRQSDAAILSAHLIWRICFVSTIIVAGIFGVFLWKISSDASQELARTMAVNTLVLFEIFYLFNVRRHRLSSYLEHVGKAARPAWIAVAIVLVLQIAFTHVPIMNLLFHSAPLSLADWIVCAVVALSVFVLVEIEKTLRDRWAGRDENNPDQKRHDKKATQSEDKAK